MEPGTVHFYRLDSAQLVLSREVVVGASVVVGMNAACLSGLRKFGCGYSVRQSGIGIAAVLGLMVVAPGMALASPGCTALNGTFTGGALTGNVTAGSFSVGDIISVTVTNAAGGDEIGIGEYNPGYTSRLPHTSVVGTHTYRVPADSGNSFTISGSFFDASSVFSWSCTAGGSSTGATDSEKLTAVQTTGSTVVANTSGANISGSVNGAIDNALNQPAPDQPRAFPPPPPFTGPHIMTRAGYAHWSASNAWDVVTKEDYDVAYNAALVYFDQQAKQGWVFYRTERGYRPEWQPSTASQFAVERRSDVSRRADDAFAALGYAAVGKAPRYVPVFAPQWSTWADVRGSGFEQSDSRALKGTQINATGGITYKLRPDLVVGAFAGYENFNYDFASLAGNLKGNGGTIGTYAGWQITPTLRWKGMIGWTGLGYDASAATASGGFDGSRWLVSTGLSGSYRVAAFVVEPSADVFAIWERQTGYTDSLGVAHDARSFSTGRVSLGGRALAPVLGPFGVTPYLGVYGDWRFASDNTLPAAVPFAGIGDGLSARVTAGFNTRVFTTGSLSLGGEYGGIGADYKLWTGKARLAVPF